jgi:hypothetical protein
MTFAALISKKLSTPSRESRPTQTQAAPPPAQKPCTFPGAPAACQPWENWEAA